MMIKLASPYGVVKEVKMGWSWTVFFFGIFPPLFRGDFKWAGIFFAIGLLLAWTTAGVGNLVLNIIMAVAYNKLYIKDLLNAGYTAVNEGEHPTLMAYIN